MMTEEQIELAARKLCELRGIDPETQVKHGTGPTNTGCVTAILLCSPAWVIAKQDVMHHLLVAEAIKAANVNSTSGLSTANI